MLHLSQKFASLSQFQHLNVLFIDHQPTSSLSSTCKCPSPSTNDYTLFSDSLSKICPPSCSSTKQVKRPEHAPFQSTLFTTKTAILNSIANPPLPQNQPPRVHVPSLGIRTQPPLIVECVDKAFESFSTHHQPTVPDFGPASPEEAGR